jgi:hypothetical protein
VHLCIRSSELRLIVGYIMKVTFCARDYANVSGGHNTWLCRFLPSLRRRGIESRVLCFHLSPEEEFPLKQVREQQSREVDEVKAALAP